METNYYKEKNYRNYLYSGFLKILFEWQHKVLSPKIYRNCEKVLEVGGGFEPHIKFVNLNFKEYYCLEKNENLKFELEKYYKENFSKIIFSIYDGKNLNFPDNYFDRIIISHTLEHIPNFEQYLHQMMRIIKVGGVISIASPCDNGFLWRFGRFILNNTYHRLKKIPQIDCDYIISKEHINTIFQIKAVLKKKFNIKKEIYLPFIIKIIDINLFHICHIIKK